MKQYFCGLIKVGVCGRAFKIDVDNIPFIVFEFEVNNSMHDC